ncbi:hypothetical protein NB311A_04983 [Nitrobacter sp. Nb-311A]|nr:hypothetical protein NB311A_04983 [Nitrobacter sp. Nb-311A]
MSAISDRHQTTNLGVRSSNLFGRAMHDLHELVTLSALEWEEIKRADAYYAGKVFEYPQMFEAVRAYPNDPEISHLMTSAEKLVAGLYRPCLEAA